MNTVKLKGTIHDIEHSHTIADMDFNKATVLVSSDNHVDRLNVRFKKFSCPYQEGDEVSFTGNIRSYSSRLSNGKNKVDLYVFTYFDDSDDESTNNKVELDGRICKINSLRTTKSGKYSLHFILANNLIVNEGTKKLNSYIPCIVWDDTALELSKLSINTKLKVTGKLHSREYTKTLDDGTVEVKTAHECVVDTFEIL